VSKGQTNKLPTKIIREALEATLFSSSDPNAAITGPIARLYVNGSDLEVVTYDSLCGAIYSKTIDGLRNGLKIVLPNRLLWTLLSFVNDDTFDLTYDPNVSLIFATKTCRIFVTLNEYPDIDVGTLIRNLLAGVTEGIRVNPNKVSHTVSSIIAVGAADKEITNLIVDHRTNKVRFGINSEAINCAEIVECEPASTKTNMSIIVDSKRFLNFLKPCKSLATVDILHGGGRVIVKAEHATFAFSVV
jgi:hypothetical protein